MNKGKKTNSKKGKALDAQDWLFIKDYLEHGDATHAYYAAGRNGKFSSSNASRWLSRPQVQKALNEAHAKAVTRISSKLEITVDKVLGDLETARMTALDAMPSPQCAAAIKASELQGRHIGMFSEDYGRDKEAPLIHITVAGGAQIAVVGREQGALSLPTLPHIQLEDDMEYLTDADLLREN